ncbi:hypothetical protein FJTKL_14873 [Diaporthe vaccinii]|uniref:Uncharacterized protein n=1 Tax=Diaporthe vaccinii TaxID=105482 RepID=A0ABR4F8F8_9PEZI
MDPGGISMVLPSVATMITVPLSVTPRPRLTAPVMVRWSSSMILGMEGMCFWKSETFLKSDLTSIRSEQVLTGRKRRRGTLTPCALLKWRMAAPTAVSSWTMLMSLSPFLSPGMDLPLGMISISSSLFSTTRLMALMFIQMLLVLKYLNFLMDLNSLTCSLGTWAISSKRTEPS